MRPIYPGQPAPREPVTELEEIRHLLLRREQKQLRDVQAHLADKGQRAHDVSSVLPQAIKISSGRNGELTNALRPTIEGAIRDSIDRRPEVFIDALHPIIGSVVRRSIAESLRNLLQSFNQTLEHTFSWQGLKWRFEGWRTGRSFAEVVMLRSLVYRVEQLFMIHRETSLALLHVSADAGPGQDADMMAGMLSAIQDFARDSFQTGSDAALEEFRVGELQVWIAPGRHAYLAAVIRGNPPRELRTLLEETIESVHLTKASALAIFQGDAAGFESLRPELEACLRAQYDKSKSAGARKGKVPFVLAAVLGLIVAALIVGFRRQERWDNFITQLDEQPGITVTQARHGWIKKSRIAGLRDPLATDPEEIARKAKLNPAGIQFDWKDYQALDPSLVLQRFRAAYPPPATVDAALDQGVLKLTGSAAYDWIVPVREGAPKIAGIVSVADEQLKIAYPPQPVLQRFSARFGLPDGIHATIGAKKTLILEGEASHAWLAQVRVGAKEIPGIDEIDDREVIDLDSQTFKETKSVIESAFIYFLVDKDNFATEGFAALSRLPDQIRRCLDSAKRLGYAPVIEIQGHADAVGGGARNVDLSQRRAAAVQTFLVACGFDPHFFRVLGLGAPAVAGVAVPEQSDRRAEFKVVLNPGPTTP
ncbi:MAG: OmpA family protein [Chthoniobacterales bacterium]